MFLYGATLFLSAFLLFLIQPMIGKWILPWFGGAPAVWTTCLLFFQILLLAGYGYAHALARIFTPRKQSIVHVALLTASVLTILCFSVFPARNWNAGTGGSPVLGILGLLFVGVGAPYFVLSSTSPLLQTWFSHAKPGISPYRLYAVSNLGSLLAIVAYPLVIEPSIRLSRQGSLFVWAFVLFSALCAAISLKAAKSPLVCDPEILGASVSCVPEEDCKPGAGLWLLWLSLAACSSVMLLATTSQLCQDLAVVPLLWILPLSLYLLSFILCFQYERLYRRPLFVPGLAAAFVWTFSVLSGGVVVELKWQILSYSLTLFLSCMVCHGELVRLKPGPRHLTAFYLMIAAGGGLGALLVTIGAPYFFRGYWEYHLGLLATGLLTILVIFRDRRGILYRGRPLWVWSLWVLIWGVWVWLAPKLVSGIWQTRQFQIVMTAIFLLTIFAILVDRGGKLCLQRPLRAWMLGALLLASWGVHAWVLRDQIKTSLDGFVDARRNFFGVLRVWDINGLLPYQHSLSLMHGRIEHGFQYQHEDKRNWPVSYYGYDSGIGLAVTQHPRRLANLGMNICVIGLGTGTMAAHGQAGDTMRFYEINPAVVELSDRYFTYRKDSKADIRVVLGDARVSLDQELRRGETENYDLIVVDAFSSDAIPVHLMTRECFQIYRRHLRDHGIIAFHVTNRYFDLKPILRNLAADTTGAPSAMQALWIEDLGNTQLGTDHTNWVLLTENQEFLANQEVMKHVTPWTEPLSPDKVWTDDYSDLLSVLHERGKGY